MLLVKKGTNENPRNKNRPRRRARLQALWNAKGCTDAEVLEAGDELDLLLNKYQRLLDEKKRTRRLVEQRHI